MPQNKSATGFDFDWLIIGSGFGGSVSALRLVEKGYKVAVIEAGRRFEDKDFAKSSWQLNRYLWAPWLGLRGIMRLTPFKDVFIGSGAGVGGGSIVYANTLYRAKEDFYRNPQWADMGDWQAELAPHYATAERMLGVETVPFDSPGDFILKDYARHIGTEGTFRRTPVGAYFGEPGKTVPDPYFGGEGPERTGCTRCGACMVGCRVGAKNTLPKNYLWFAEKGGATILPNRKVVDIAPLGDGDGSNGYEVHTRNPGLGKRRPRKFTARGVIVAAGALGTNQLLANCKHRGSLSRISDRLGHLVRTNSESMVAVTLPDDTLQTWRSVAISSSIHTDRDTHIEVCTFGEKGDFMGRLFTLLTGDGTRWTRIFSLLGNAVRHPVKFCRILWPFGWSKKSVVLLVMQSLDNALTFRAKKRRFGRGVSLRTEQDCDKPNPTYIEAGNKAAEWIAEKTGGVAQSMFMEAAANIPTTAHILGGATIGRDASHGVVDSDHRVFGYRNLIICDGSVVPANPGVNPSLTICAMTEQAMSRIPAKKHVAPTGRIAGENGISMAR
ncbi:GMC oxidoreductase [Parahaliea mediterranea]|uniref:Cholesterol oxidase n=1 Tax=Parahaliea mediterranea TaxID=651086 RepID=A0A939IM18_9GAMM|nr:GMC family oxidoreductase [Parahaliea mediterranea]MBN7796547.1 GMC family oxidoreductase [Parahaliea mediterranea]